ncbi:MAG: 16S rRNA (cytosine(1402)-N(4))-methyltransferase RsmH [Gemmatimonadota bacterium]
MASTDFVHDPVLVSEVVECLRVERDGWILDGTVGRGGHAARLLDSYDGVRLIGLDQDAEALEAAEVVLRPYGDRVLLRRGNFRQAHEILGSLTEKIELVGVLLDLGVSSHQLDTSARGFSFRRGTPLIMRMGGTTGGWGTAADLLNTESEEELGQIFREFGEERRWRALAREIVRRRAQRPFRVAEDLVAAYRKVAGAGMGPADKARIFQALRIAVNDELGALRDGLTALRDELEPGGRLAVISYHSLEDRIVKHAFREWSRTCTCPPELPQCRCAGVALGKTVTRRPITPGPDEIARNPRARSAKLRVWERAG